MKSGQRQMEGIFILTDFMYQWFLKYGVFVEIFKQFQSQTLPPPAMFVTWATSKEIGDVITSYIDTAMIRLRLKTFTPVDHQQGHGASSQIGFIFGRSKEREGVVEAGAPPVNFFHFLATFGNNFTKWFPQF